MDGANQQALIKAFFDEVMVDDSLLFTYLKHSPLQEDRGDRLIVGAARVTRVTPPPMWKQTGNPPFSSSMWETVVEHSLRSDQLDGVLLPYQALVPLLDEGADIEAALAWVPEDRSMEFSYVTEHLTDDAAIESLASLQRAIVGMRALGLEIPESADAWLDAETKRLWQLRGPTPGLASVLSHLKVLRPFQATRALLSAIPADIDPWVVLEKGFADHSSFPTRVQPSITPSSAGEPSCNGMPSTPGSGS